MEIRSWPEITVAIARGPHVLAAEIHRRLLPGYTSTYLQITRHNAGGHADQRAGEAAGLLLARQLPGATISRDGTDGTAIARWQGTGGQYGSIRLTGDGQDTYGDLRAIPLAAAVRIARILSCCQTVTGQPGYPSGPDTAPQSRNLARGPMHERHGAEQP